MSATRLPLILLAICLAACATASPSPTSNADEPAYLLYLRSESADSPLELIKRESPSTDGEALPLDVPAGCAIWSLNPSPRGPLLAVELNCGNGLAVLTMDTDTGATKTPTSEFRTDSHFLAWHPQGRLMYLKIDSLGEPRILQVDTQSGQTSTLPLPANTYDLAALPDGATLLYSVTQGIGFGSETWLADLDGNPIRRLIIDPANIIAFTRPSPRGDMIFYLLMPDTQVPFTVGELWVMDAQGENAYMLAQADAGHGYAPAWSPDGAQIAFVVRENPGDTSADQSAMALRSNISLVNVETKTITPATSFPNALVEAPIWSPDGSWLIFNVISNGTINAWMVEAMTGSLQSVDSFAFSCCAVWLPGR